MEGEKIQQTTNHSLLDENPIQQTTINSNDLSSQIHDQ
jgi:hypothetical protein